MKMKKALAFLFGLTLTIQSAAVSAFAEELGTPDELLPDSEPVTEETEMRDSVPHLYAAPYELQSTVLSAELVEAPEEDLPASFDLRKEGLVTPVRNQGDLGTCWAHAVLGCLETDGIRDNPFIDLSERYLATFIISNEYGDGSNDFMKGSNSGNALGLLTNWIGAVSESVAPYDQEFTNSLSRKEVQKQAEKHVTNVRYFSYYNQLGLDPHLLDYTLDPVKLQVIKQEICRGNAVHLSLNFDKDHAISQESALYNDPQNTVPDYGHAVVIVGYDDHFSAENFITPPPGDGAWLIKNSWGIENGDNGYYWVSYYEQTIDEVAVIEAVSAEQHDNLYSHDDFGVSGCFASEEEGDESVYISNIYTAEENGFVTDVTFFNAVPGDQYEITVFTGLADETDPKSGEAHTAVTEAMPYLGYRTMTLPEPVYIRAGEQFSIVAEISGEQGYHIMCEFANKDTGEPVGYTKNPWNIAKANDLVLEKRINETFGAGQSFYSTDGQSWNDLYDSYEFSKNFLTGNICLRAMTVSEGKVQFSTYSETLAPGTDIALSCADGSNIYYSVDGSAYQLYTAPITFTKEMTVSAYVEGEESNVYTHHYAEKKACCSSILVKTDNDRFYADLNAEETDITLPWYSESCTLLPITTGSVKNGSTVTDSYEPIVLKCGMESVSCTLTAEEEGLQPTNYRFCVSREVSKTFAEGIWKPIDTNTGWYYFDPDGESGYSVDRISGKKTAFKYDITDHVLTLTEEKTVRTAKIASNEFNAMLEWDNGQTESIMHFSPEENAPFFTNPEICAFAEAYAAAVTGKTPAEVRAEICDMDCNVIVTVTMKTGETLVYNVNESTMIGSDQDGNVVILNEIPDSNPVTAIRPGIWKIEERGIIQYYWFSADKKSCRIYNTYDGSYTDGTYLLKNSQLQLVFGEQDVRQALLKQAEDAITLVWPYSYLETMTYTNDADADSFTFLSNLELRQLAHDYYEATCCIDDAFDYFFNMTDDIVTLYSNDNNVIYHVSRFTGLGTDQLEHEIDLQHPVETASEPIGTGVWVSHDPLDQSLSGYYVFEADGKSGLFIDIWSGTEIEFTYRRVGSNGIAFSKGEKLHFTCSETEDGFVLSWMDAPHFPSTSPILFREEKTREEFSIYSVRELIDMAQTDYECKTGNRKPIELFSFDENDHVILEIFDPETGTVEDQYILDPVSGTGINQNGEIVNLPQTGNNSLTALFTFLSALMMTGFGAFAMKQSGMLRRKEEQ